MSTYLDRPIFPIDLNLQADEQRWIYDDSAREIGLNGPATLPAQTFAKQRVKLLAESLDAETSEEVENWLEGLSLDARSTWFPCDLGEATILSIEDVGARKVRIAGQGWDTNLAFVAGMVLRFLAGDVMAVAKVTAVEAAGDDEIITLDVLPAGLSAGWHVSRLILGRVVDFGWVHLSEGLSDLEIGAIELPLEYADPAGADGTVRADVYLYTITRYVTASDIVCWRMTSAPDALIHDGKAYAPAQIDHGKVATGTEGDTDQLDLKLGVWAHNPFNSWFPRHSAGSFGVIVDRVAVDRATATSVGEAKRIFRGEAVSAERQGAVISVACKSPLAFANNRAPSFMIQTVCNYSLYDANTCGVVEDNYRIEGEIAALDAGAATVDLEAADLAGKAASWLVRGYITITMDGETETRFIRSALVLSDTRHRLTLNIPTTLAEVGAAAVALPGCEKTYTGEAGCPRFNNQASFGGHPFLPSYNPSVSALKPPTASGGGKK